MLTSIFKIRYNHRIKATCHNVNRHKNQLKAITIYEDIKREVYHEAVLSISGNKKM